MGQIYNSSWEHVDISALIDGVNGDGVVDGLGVSESATPAMTVLVASGSCEASGVRYTEGSGQNLNISNGDATHPRKDIVVYDTSAGNPAIVEGSPAAAPIPPDIPSGDIYLALVHVDANETTSVVNADIDEGRVYVDPLPSGLIMMWHGLLSAIPTGWVLCDGNNSTPDLRSSFVRGAPAATEAGSTGGSDTHTLTTAEMPAHTHTSYKGCYPGGPYCGQGGADSTKTGESTSSTGGDGSHNNMPAYYEIIYIMKS